MTPIDENKKSPDMQLVRWFLACLFVDVLYLIEFLLLHIKFNIPAGELLPPFLFLWVVTILLGPTLYWAKREDRNKGGRRFLIVIWVGALVSGAAIPRIAEIRGFVESPPTLVYILALIAFVAGAVARLYFFR